MQYFVLWRLAQALVIHEAHRLVVHRCELMMAGTTGDVTRKCLLSNSGKDSLDIVTNVACKDSCHNQQQSDQYCERQSATQVVCQSLMPTQTVDGKLGWHLGLVSYQHACLSHMQVCTLRKRMYTSNVRNCSQKDTAVASAAPK